jgi:NAD-dependent deacetylase
VTTDKLRAQIAKARRVAVLTGAGISAESGVPTFRSPDGIWARFNPEELANINAFMRNPELVWEWYTHRRDVVNNAKPNAGHYALVEMEKYFERVDIITQNVDGLHERAGSTHIHELHGSLNKHRCLDCEAPYALRNDETGVPHCPKCGGLIRPGVVWFGEMLPEDAWQKSEDAVRHCDLFLTVGTSAVVFPAAGLAYDAVDRGAFVIEVNPEPTDFTPYASLSLRGAAGEELPTLIDLVREVRSRR